MIKLLLYYILKVLLSLVIASILYDIVVTVVRWIARLRLLNQIDRQLRQNRW